MIVVANHAAAGVLGGTDFVWVIFAITLGLSFLMVSTVRFRSFKEIRLNARTVLLIAGAVGSSAVISYKSEPQFALVWLAQGAGGFVDGRPGGDTEARPVSRAKARSRRRPGSCQRDSRMPSTM